MTTEQAMGELLADKDLQIKIGMKPAHVRLLRHRLANGTIKLNTAKAWLDLAGYEVQVTWTKK